MKKLRFSYTGMFCALLCAEILVALFVHDNFIRPYIGDVLVTLLLCSFLRIFFPRGIALLPFCVFLFATAVEIAQYFDFVALLGIKSRFLSVLLGRTFSWADILCYALGCLIGFAVDLVSQQALSKNVEK